MERSSATLPQQRAAGVAQCLVAGAADPALPSRGRVQAQRQVECRGGGPERLVFGVVVASVLERILGDHCASEAQACGAQDSGWTANAR
jgi:hypothetical protein